MMKTLKDTGTTQWWIMLLPFVLTAVASYQWIAGAISYPEWIEVTSIAGAINGGALAIGGGLAKIGAGLKR